MKRRLLLRRQVPDDLNEIIDYLRGAAPPDVAPRFLGAYAAAVVDLSRHPGRGSPKLYRGLPEYRSYARCTASRVT